MRSCTTEDALGAANASAPESDWAATKHSSTHAKAQAKGRTGRHVRERIMPDWNYSKTREEATPGLPERPRSVPGAQKGKGREDDGVA
jgi:hypothetical protein